MKLKTLIKALFIFTIIAGTSNCKNNTENKKVDYKKEKLVGTFNYDNKQELTEYRELNLDETHPNLLNPQISTSDYNSVIKSWKDLHQRIGNHLSNKKFTWEVEDSYINIVQKIYFKPNGEIKYIFFNVLNPNVTQEKKEQFAKLISDFANTNRIDFKLDKSFAQCGKIKYTN